MVFSDSSSSRTRIDQPSAPMISPSVGADADRVDAHAAVGGHARRLDRVGAGGRLAVGEQDDRRADV